MVILIIGENIKLIALNEEHKESILIWVNNPRLKDLTGTIYPISDLEHSKWFDNNRVSNTEKTYGILDGEDKFIGLVGLKKMDFISRNAELFIYIGNERKRGQGLGRDALNTLVRFSFDGINLHKLYLSVFEYNEEAVGLYKSIGFKKEGVLKEHLFRNGNYHNVLVLSKINNKGEL